MEDHKQNNNSSQKSNEEEIDLGQLFSLIGKGFSNFFNFFGRTLSAIFSWIMSVLLFVKKHTLKLAIGTVLGAVGGGLYQANYKVPTYESSMTVQPNFGSTIQLYKNIDLYQNLVRQKDVERLATNLNISIEEAKTISMFEVEPYSNANETLLAFKRFTTGLDSITLSKIDFESFTDSQPIESYKFHIVNVVSKDKYIFGKLRSPIISSIVRNAYYDQVKSTSYLNLLSTKKALESSMNELDSLRGLYKEVMISESKKTTSGTNIYMSATDGNNKEIVVFDKYMRMNEELIYVNKKLTEENDVINVVSSFNPVGMKLTGLKRNYIILGGILGFMIVFLTYGVLILNTKLIEYEEKMKA